MTLRDRKPAATKTVAAGFVACAVAVAGLINVQVPVAASVQAVSVASTSAPAPSALSTSGERVAAPQPKAMATSDRFIVAAQGESIAKPSGVAKASSASVIAKTFVAGHKWNKTRQPRKQELATTSVQDSLNGGKTVRLQQSYQGIPVLGAQAVVQLDSKGDIKAANSETLTGAVADLTAGIGPAKARLLALASVAKSESVDPASLYSTEIRKYIYDPALFSIANQLPRLVWAVSITGQPGSQADVGQQVLVDANSGAIRLSLPTQEHARDRAICDGANDRSISASTVPCTSPARSESGGANAQAQVNQAYQGAGDFYDYISANFGRDSIDNAGMKLRATVRFCPATSSEGDCPYNDSFWDTSEQQVFLGDGTAQAEDIVAHEFTHGLVEHTSGLIYYQQSGALNEGLADVFGEFVDQASHPSDHSNDWLIGQDLPGGAIRSMSDPTAFGSPDRMSSPLFYVGDEDYGGVHQNSGVVSKFAYLLSAGADFNGHSVTGVGVTKASAIIYQAALLLTSTSDYPIFAQALRSACSTLVGSSTRVGAQTISSADCASVNEAILATEMDNAPANAVVAQAAQCDTGRVAVPLWSDDMENPDSGNWQSSDPAIWRYGSRANAVKPAGGTDNLWGASPQSAVTASMTQTAAITIPANGFMYFDQAYAFEFSQAGNWDGGVIEYSTDGGSSWQDAGSLIDAGLAYNGTTHSSDAFGVREAFVRETPGFNYGSTRLDLDSLAGQSVKFRFVVGSDASLAAAGWFIDNVSVYSCTISGNGLLPLLNQPTPTQNGFTVAVTNYDPAFAWTVAATAGATAEIDSQGLVTVTGLSPAVSSVLTVRTSLVGNPNRITQVSGSSLGVAGPLTFSLGNFGSVPTGSAKSLQVMVTNTGSASAPLTALSALGSGVMVSGGSCAVGGQLAAAGSCSVILSWTPMAIGAFNGSLQLGYLRYSAAASDSGSLSGTATAAPPTGSQAPPEPTNQPAIPTLTVPGKPAAVKVKAAKTVLVTWADPSAGGAVASYQAVVVKKGSGKALARVSVPGSSSGKYTIKLAQRKLIKNVRKVSGKLRKGSKVKFQVKITAVNAAGAGMVAVATFTLST